MSRYKAVLLGEWVKVANLRNKRFDAGDACRICGRLSCAPVWYSLNTHEVRCTKCFDAEAAHWNGSDTGLALVRSEAEWPYIKPYLAKNRRLK